MGDIVTCTAVLHGPDEHGVEHLLLMVGGLPWVDYRNIPVRTRGTARQTEQPEWEYEWRGGDVLHMQPSLLCPDTAGPFHTDYNWTVKFVRLAPEAQEDAFTLFGKLNNLPEEK